MLAPKGLKQENFNLKTSQDKGSMFLYMLCYSQTLSQKEKEGFTV